MLQMSRMSQSVGGDVEEATQGMSTRTAPLQEASQKSANVSVFERPHDCLIGLTMTPAVKGVPTVAATTVLPILLTMRTTTAVETSIATAIMTAVDLLDATTTISMTLTIAAALTTAHLPTMAMNDDHRAEGLRRLLAPALALRLQNQRITNGAQSSALNWLLD